MAGEIQTVADNKSYGLQNFLQDALGIYNTYLAGKTATGTANTQQQLLAQQQAAAIQTQQENRAIMSKVLTFTGIGLGALLLVWAFTKILK